MIKKTIQNSNGKNILIFDEIFSHREKEYFEYCMLNERYNYSNTKTSPNTSHLPSTFLHYRLNMIDVDKLRFFNNPFVNEIVNSFNNLELIDAWYNLSLPGTYYSIHTDLCGDIIKDQVTFMYYGTTTWREEYGGETFFYNDNLEKEIVVDYKPGRLVVFDSSIPHKPAFSYGHIVGRYVFVCLFRSKNG